MVKYYTILTNVGKAKVANAQVLDRKVDIVHIAVGDGNANPIETQTSLTSEKWRGQISTIGTDPENPNWIVIEAIIPPDVGGFNVSEVGVFDTAGDLIAIGKYPETYKPVLEEGSAKDLYLRMIIEVSNASVVTLKIDPAVVIATRKYVDGKFTQSIGPINQVVTEIKDGTTIIPSLQTENKTLAGSINELKSNVGELTGLTTVQKANLVTAINEIVQTVAAHSTDKTSHLTEEERTMWNNKADQSNLISVGNLVAYHEQEAMPHLFIDEKAITYRYGFKTNSAKDGLIFVYEEVF